MQIFIIIIKRKMKLCHVYCMETILQLRFLFMCLHLCRYLITAPNIIHIGVEETVSVQLHGANKPAHVTLYFKAPFQDTKLCEPKIVTLNDDNQHQAVVTLKASPHHCYLVVMYSLFYLRNIKYTVGRTGA